MIYMIWSFVPSWQKSPHNVTVCRDLSPHNVSNTCSHVHSHTHHIHALHCGVGIMCTEDLML